MKIKKKSVTDKINELLKPSLNSDEDSDDEINKDTAPRVVDFEEDEYDVPDARSSDFRKRNVKLLSEQSARYKGKITSRKELREEDDSESEDEDNVLGDSSEEEDVQEGDEEADEEDESDDAELDDEDDDEETDDDEAEEADTATDIISESNRQAEIQKGVSVQNQLRIWERLLEIRIQTQKMLTKVNQLPISAEDNGSPYRTETAQETAVNTCVLLKSLLELKTAFTSQFSELRSSLKRPLKDLSALRDYTGGEPPLKRIAVQLDEQHSDMQSFRNTVLLKWDDRTKLLKPGGAKRKTTEEFDIIRKIENALLNKDTLIAKSRQLQNVNSTNEHSQDGSLEVAAEQQAASDPNIYDDSDFYHQQLRELIEYKANSSSNMAEVTKQMVELQKIRQKMKKKVDTRASKGRKIRYVVHNKLINFMAPDDSDSVNWTNESKDELYKSLFI